MTTFGVPLREKRGMDLFNHLISHGHTQLHESIEMKREINVIRRNKEREMNVWQK